MGRPSSSARLDLLASRSVSEIVAVDVSDHHRALVEGPVTPRITGPEASAHSDYIDEITVTAVALPDQEDLDQRG